MASLCYCGHDCSRCVTYLATRNNDDHLRERSRRFYREAFGMELPTEKFHCCGGRSERIFEPARGCPFRKCCGEHKVESCSMCPEYPCRMIADYREKYVNKCNQI